MKFRRNWFTTIGGIMSGFTLIPIAWGTAINQHVIGNYPMPGWLFLLCVCLGALGPVVIGVGAKGQDEDK